MVDLPRHTQDPDDLYGDAVVAKIEITYRRNGSMSTAGSIEDKKFALWLLDNARDAVISHHARKTKIVVPAKDVELPPLDEALQLKPGQARELF